ncbi:MAG: SDR family NAD(P)-dependent oxidoreductase [Alphaproteobacteria bacterium]
MVLKPDALAGKLAVVTGGSRGIGRAAAIEMAKAGAKLVLTARTAAACEAAAEAVRAAGGAVASLHGFDVADVAATEAFAAEVQRRHGAVDILVNNAGVGTLGTVEAMAPEELERMLAINVVGPYTLIRALLPAMLARKAGVIINITSARANMPAAGYGAYCASKAGLMALGRCLALELDGTGVRMVGFSPGFTATDMLDDLYSPQNVHLAAIPASAAHPPQRPARIIAWLATDAAADLAGREIGIQWNDITLRAGLEG